MGMIDTAFQTTAMVEPWASLASPLEDETTHIAQDEAEPRRGIFR
jgi:hypothetical protein